MAGHDQSKDEGGFEATDPADVDTFLRKVGFDQERSLLTRRQAAVFVMRESGFTQATIAEHIGTTRENVSGIEARARENVEKARETVEFVAAVSAPIRVEIPTDTDLYDAPTLVFDACDEAGVKVGHNAPELMKLISDAAGSAVDGRAVKTTLVVTVTSDGTVQVSKQSG